MYSGYSSHRVTLGAFHILSQHLQWSLQFEGNIKSTTVFFQLSMAFFYFNFYFFVFFSCFFLIPLQICAEPLTDVLSLKASLEL